MQEVGDECCNEVPLFEIVRPRFFAWDKEGKQHVFMSSTDDGYKKQWLFNLRLQFAHLGIIQYVFACEGYSLVVEGDTPEDAQRAYKDLMKDKDSLSEISQSEEHIFIIGANHDTTRVARALIRGNRQVDPLHFENEGKLTDSSDNFKGLLIKDPPASSKGIARVLDHQLKGFKLLRKIHNEEILKLTEE